PPSIDGRHHTAAARHGPRKDRRHTRGPWSETQARAQGTEARRVRPRHVVTGRRSVNPGADGLVTAAWMAGQPSGSAAHLVEVPQQPRRILEHAIGPGAFELLGAVAAREQTD